MIHFCYKTSHSPQGRERAGDWEWPTCREIGRLIFPTQSTLQEYSTHYTCTVIMYTRECTVDMPNRHRTLISMVLAIIIEIAVSSWTMRYPRWGPPPPCPSVAIDLPLRTPRLTWFVRRQGGGLPGLFPRGWPIRRSPPHPPQSTKPWWRW